jgi:hypothetical protein
MKTTSSLFKLLPFIGLLLFSCTKEGLFMDSSDKIMGEWRFEKVTFKKDNAIFQKNLTDEYSEVELTFYKDYTFSEIDNASGKSYLGSWNIDDDEDNSSIDNKGEKVYQEKLVGTKTDQASGIVFLVNWKNLDVSKRKVTAIERKDDGTYTYILKRP